MSVTPIAALYQMNVRYTRFAYTLHLNLIHAGAMKKREHRVLRSGRMAAEHNPAIIFLPSLRRNGFAYAAAAQENLVNCISYYRRFFFLYRNTLHMCASASSSYTHTSKAHTALAYNNFWLHSHSTNDQSYRIATATSYSKIIISCLSCVCGCSQSGLHVGEIAQNWSASSYRPPLHPTYGQMWAKCRTKGSD